MNELDLADKPDDPPKYSPNDHMDIFEREVAHLINRMSLENGSHTPDFIIAAYLRRCLENYNSALIDRTRWYGK